MFVVLLCITRCFGKSMQQQQTSDLRSGIRQYCLPSGMADSIHRDSTGGLLKCASTGHELNNDASTLAPLDIRNRTVLLCQVSLEPNKFSMSPAEYKPLYETTSLSWMLSQAVGCGCDATLDVFEYSQPQAAEAAAVWQVHLS